MKQHPKGLWTSNITALQKAYVEDFESLKGDTESRIRAQTFIDDSIARYNNNVIGVGFLPKLYDMAALARFDDIVRRTYVILEKMTQHYLDDAKYRALFGFSPLLERLILLPTPYETAIPISRIDIFLDEDTGNFKFCEFNTDGTSAMVEDREIGDALALGKTLNSYGVQHNVKGQELIDTWVETFMSIYDSSTYALPSPVVAIVDYMDSAVTDEQLEFRNRFAHYGVNCLVVDISSLEYKNGALYGRDVSKEHPAHHMPLRIDAVYRRVVTYELLKELEASEESIAKAHEVLSQGPAEGETLHGELALIAAVAAGNVCMQGNFKTQVAHSKASFCMLHHPQTLAVLSEDEQQFIKEHVPFTTWLKAENIDTDTVKQTREDWIIKPVDGYSSKGVQAGKSVTDEEWHTLIDEKLQEDYIIQEYCPQYATLNIPLVPEDDEGNALFDDTESAEKCARQGLYNSELLLPYNILTGLYCYGGTFSGIYIRCGRDAVIVGFRDGISLAALLVDFDAPEGFGLRSRTIMK